MANNAIDNKMKREPEDLSFGDIVWGQFKKNRVAYASMWALIGLFLLAICAPIFASGRPFIWTADGETIYPWFTALFDRGYYENGVDIFFNLLLVLGLPLIGVWFLRQKMLVRSNMKKRPRRRQLKREGLALIGVFFLVFGYLLFNPSSKPYEQYYDTYQLHEMRANLSDFEAALNQEAENEEDLTEAQHALLKEAKRLNLRTVEDLEKTKTEDSAESLSATFAPIPYAFRKTGFKSGDSPSGKHWLGVDTAGRDVAVQMLYGIRISLSIGVIAVGIYVTIGIIVGAIAGFFSGKIDMIIQRIIEIVMSVPTLIVLLVLIAFIEKPSIYHIMLVIGLFRWTGVARLVRGEFYRLRNLDFVTSAVALGYPTRRIIFQHILPNALGPVLVAATFGVAAAILMESSLSFLGLGDVSVPSWGQTLSDGYKTNTWHKILASSPPSRSLFSISLVKNSRRIRSQNAEVNPCMKPNSVVIWFN